MRQFIALLLLLGTLAGASAADATGRVLKVLPFLLDRQGQDSPSPSLFDRDAYQARLRERGTNEVTGVRVDILWSIKHAANVKYTVRAELRGVGPDGVPHFKQFTSDVQPGWFHQWTSFQVAGPEYRDFGTLVAWRATLWEDDRQLAEQHSFLW